MLDVDVHLSLVERERISLTILINKYNTSSTNLPKLQISLKITSYRGNSTLTWIKEFRAVGRTAVIDTCEDDVEFTHAFCASVKEASSPSETHP